MRDHFLQDPIDHLDFHTNLSQECAKIEEALRDGAYFPGASRRILVEKSKGLCRQLVIPSLRDAIILQSLSDALYRDIRGKEPTKKAYFEPEDHSFSKKKVPFTEPDYGSFRAWLNFQQELFRFSRERNYIVITDIANYYDTISYTHLRNIISGIIPDLREAILDMLIYVLGGLLWQPDYMPRVEVGLPQINTDAPRILGHCFLYELDQFLDKKFGGDFARYMDDLDIGVDTPQEAKEILKCVDLVLHTRQIRINSGKTLILKAEEAKWHYRIRDNAFIDRVEDHINRRVSMGLPLVRERNGIRHGLRRTYFRKRYDQGNGEKILKRVLKLSRKIGAEVPNNIFYDIVLRRANVRQAALFLMSQLPASYWRISILHKVIQEGHLVDDASYVMISNALVECVMPRRRGFNARIRGLIDAIPEANMFTMYATLQLHSKYSSDAEVLDYVSRTRRAWRDDPWLARLVGGLYPRFIGRTTEANFRALVLGAEASAALETYTFHDDLRRSVEAFNKCFNYIKAGNPTKRIGTSHPRFLLAVTALSNSSVPNSKKQAILNGLGNAWSDAYYRDIAGHVTSLPMPTFALPVPLSL